MKTLNEIIKQKPIFLNDWEKSKKDEIIKEFEEYDNEWNKIKIERIEEWEILFASYTYESCSGDAFILCAKNGKLYEVNGSHCSCYKLEGQWNPEETSVELLKFRILEGSFGKNWEGESVFRDELMEFLGINYK